MGHPHRKISVGFNILNATYETLSNQSLNNLRVVSFEGGAPPVTSGTLNLDLRSRTIALFSSLGVTDNLDVAVALPVVQVSLDGRLTQTQTAGDVILPASVSSSGIGDLALAAKYRFWHTGGQYTHSNLAAFVTVRAPTGDAENLRGLDAWRTLLSMTWSSVLGGISWHGSGGYELWSAPISLSNTLTGNRVETVFVENQVQYGVGLEVEAHPRLTVFAELMGRHLLGAGQIETQTFAVGANPFGITSLQQLVVVPEGIRKLALSPGVKWNIVGRGLLQASILISLSDDGLRDKFIPMIGLDWDL